MLLNSTARFVLNTIHFCQQHKIRVFLVQNSFKDFYINAFLHPGVTILFTWSDFFSKQYDSYNVHNQQTKWVASGYPAYASIHAYKPTHPIDFYARKYRFNPATRIVLYTCINPAVYDREMAIVRFVSETLQAIDPRIILLVRTNPMDISGEISELKMSNTRVMRSGCVYDNRLDNLYCDEQDAIEFFDLLHFTSLVVSVPSTVAVEAYLFQKTLVNICFDECGQTYPPFRTIYESEFYSLLPEELSSVVNARHELPDVLGKSLNYMRYTPRKIDAVGTAVLHSSSMDIIEAEIRKVYSYPKNYNERH
jgi:hypothetical protein